jgi:hypothetical protein
MYIIKYRAAEPRPVCMCEVCTPKHEKSDEPIRMANMDAFVRIELINKDTIVALGTNLQFENAKTLFLSCQPGCVVVKRILL